MKLLMVFLIVFCIGCELPDRKDADAEYYERGIRVVTVDSCEYIIVFGDAIVHKQNCTYCEQRNIEHSIELPGHTVNLPHASYWGNSYFVDSLLSVDTTRIATYKNIK